MALPTAQTTQTFSSDQTLNFRAKYWDTVSTAIRLGPAHSAQDQYTAFGAGVSMGMFDLFDPAFAPTNRSEIETALAASSGKTRAVLGYGSNGTYRMGVVPNIYMYWGAGTPPGASRSKQVLLKFSGRVVETGTVTLVFAGQGTVQVYRNASNTPAVAGRISEPEPQVSLTGVTSARITSEWGYQYVTLSLTKGDLLDIYYWHNGEPWGGICAKVYPGTITSTSTTFLKEVRDAAVLGASFMTQEVAGTFTPLAATTVPYLKGASLTTRNGAVSDLTLTVALTQKGDGNGFFLDTFRDEGRLVDNENVATVVKKGRMVHFEGGFRHDDGSDELYARFTGYIEDIIPDAASGTAAIVCKSFEGLVANPFDENNPDRLSYHANGYIMRQRAAEPVFGVPAYDYWPLEVAVRDLLSRSGIDAYNIGLSPFSLAPNFAKFRYITTVGQQSVYGAALLSARHLASSTKPILIERNANYGNIPPLNNEALPVDDPYLFGPQVTQRIFDRVKQLTDHYGFDFFFNPEGRAVLTGRNNPVYFQYGTTTGTYMTPAVEGGDQFVNVSAVGGIYFKKRHGAVGGNTWTRVITGKFSRLDLYTALGVDPTTGHNGGKINVQIEVNDGAGNWSIKRTVVLSTYYAGAEGFYYNGLLRSDGTNAAVFKILGLPFDHYRVTISAGGIDTAANASQTDCVYRINGVAVYERDPEQSFYANGADQRVFTTLANTLSVTPESNYKDLRNHVIVVGARKATITDSSKINNETTNPNNPEFEFHVAVAVDPFSIYDPTSANYVGMKRMTVIFDDKVNDSEFARWLTRTILFRYRMPKSSARFAHTIIPMLEPRDAMFVVEERNRSVEHILYVSSFSETWTVNDDGTVIATTNIDGEATPELPSFQPREDIDIDTLYRRDPSDPRSGVPLINMKVDYKNVYGVSVSNLQLWDQERIKAFVTKKPGAGPMALENVNNTSVLRTAFPPIPETMYLAQGVSTTNPGSVPTYYGNYDGFNLTSKRVLVNTPYRRFFYLNGWDSSRKPNVNFAFEEGDGTAGVYDKAYYGFPTTGQQWTLGYDYFLPRQGMSQYSGGSLITAASPFYDPYSSEVGNLVNISFDLLVSGRVRVVVFDAHQRSVAGVPIPVAYLTNPAADPEQQDAHWSYMEAGKVSFAWDGVDNIGYWNVLQTSALAQELAGSFGDKPMAIGRGFYAANDETTSLHTLIGDLDNANFDSTNQPYFTIGKFGQFMIRVEVVNDTLARKDLENTGRSEPRTVWSDDLPNAGTWNETGEVYVWTHLGDPSQVAIRIQDYVSGTPWTRETPRSDALWSSGYSTPDTDATVRVGKPVRMTFVPRPRRSPFFTDGNLVSVKLTRLVHLKATIFDQFWTLFGKAWEDFHSDYDVIGAEKKRVTSRMYHNEDHTLEYEDGAWRTGTNLSLFEWVFDPSLFEKDFGNGFTEALKYGDYEQLEALPGFDHQKLGGVSAQERAYILMAFINYLFYFSAHTLDRSGRRQWCLNNWTSGANTYGFVDKTKIMSPNWLSYTGLPGDPNYRKEALVDYERGLADRYLVRTIYARQWKEPGWLSGTYAGNPVTAYTISGSGLNFVQPYVKDFAPEAGVLLGDITDNWIAQYRTLNSEVNKLITANVPYSNGAGKATMPAIPSNTLALSALGTWSFDVPTVEDFFRPSPARDFHPYWRYPLMPDWAIKQPESYTADRFTKYPLHVLAGPASNVSLKVRDIAAQPTWYGHAFSFKTGFNVAKYYGARLEQSVEERGGENPSRLGRLTVNEINNIFDYQRQDELDRFDQYRGVITRGPYPDRQATGPQGGIQWDDAEMKRVGAVQPVRPAGVYLLNLGRYSDYTVAPLHSRLGRVATNNGSNPGTNGPRIHWLGTVTDWYDLRFAHEFVWYSPRYFPVTEKGGALYMFTRDEYTKVSDHVGAPWWATRQGSRLFDIRRLRFDAGAWTGFKWDVKSADWTADPHLRWNEITARTLTTTLQASVESIGGGYGWGGLSPIGTAVRSHTWEQMGVFNIRRANIFDEQYSYLEIARLAVGPEIPEAKKIVMNLTLPENLR